MSDLDDLFSLSGRTAIVTGAGGLLGQAFVRGLVMAGAKVVMLDKSKERLKQSADGIDERYAHRLELLECDITDEIDTETCIGNLSKRSNIHILVNSAAIDPKFDMDSVQEGEAIGAFTNYSLDNWKRSLDVNLTGTFIISRAVCRQMEKQNSGVIVNISSTYGITGPDQRIYKSTERSFEFFKPVDYSVTKAGILGFTRALAAYYQGTGIRVNALTPGGTLNNQSEEFIEHYSYRTITGRMATPNDYVGAIIFLCSDTSSYMTGSNLIVDGGWTAI